MEPPFLRAPSGQNLKRNESFCTPSIEKVEEWPILIQHRDSHYESRIISMVAKQQLLTSRVTIISLELIGLERLFKKVKKNLVGLM